MSLISSGLKSKWNKKAARSRKQAEVNMLLRTMPWILITEWVYSEVILDFCTRWRWVVSFKPLQLYSQRNGLRYPLYKSLDGSQSRSGLNNLLERETIENKGRQITVYSNGKLFANWQRFLINLYNCFIFQGIHCLLNFQSEQSARVVVHVLLIAVLEQIIFSIYMNKS
jgi:hypothetical protein